MTVLTTELTLLRICTLLRRYMSLISVKQYIFKHQEYYQIKKNCSAEPSLSFHLKK